MRKAGKCVDCGKPAQTEANHRRGSWSPYWCRECDEKRIARIDAGLAKIVNESGQILARRAKEEKDG